MGMAGSNNRAQFTAHFGSSGECEPDADFRYVGDPNTVFDLNSYYAKCWC